MCLYCDTGATAYEGQGRQYTDDGTESLFEESDDGTDEEGWFFDYEERHPPEYYLHAAASLDVARLRQK